MLRKPGICQKPVITLYETPTYAACGMAVGAEPTGVQPGTGTPENGGVADEILFGWQYEVLEEKDSFYKIRTHYGYEGWIAAEEYVSMESVGDTGVCYDAQNSGCAMQLLQVCQNIADVLEAERVQARRITTLYAGSLIWAEKDSALGDSNAAACLLQPGWRRVFLPDGMGGLREGYMRSRFLETCQGQERWRKWAPQRPTVLTERIDAVSQSEPKEQEDADALRSEEAFLESIVQTSSSPRQITRLPASRRLQLTVPVKSCFVSFATQSCAVLMSLSDSITIEVFVVTSHSSLQESMIGAKNRRAT